MVQEVKGRADHGSMWRLMRRQRSAHIGVLHIPIFVTTVVPCQQWGYRKCAFWQEKGLCTGGAGVWVWGAPLCQVLCKQTQACRGHAQKGSENISEKKKHLKNRVTGSSVLQQWKNSGPILPWTQDEAGKLWFVCSFKTNQIKQCIYFKSIWPNLLFLVIWYCVHTVWLVKHTKSPCGFFAYPWLLNSFYFSIRIILELVHHCPLCICLHPTAEVKRDNKVSIAFPMTSFNCSVYIKFEESYIVILQIHFTL